MKKLFLTLILLSTIAKAQTNISVNNIKATGNVTANGTVTGSNIPASIPGAGTCVNQFVRVLNAGAPPTCSTVGTGDLAASLALITPSIDAASGISLNLSGNLTFGSSTNNLSAFAATTSAQLRGVLSDETGTGAAVFAGGNIGAATATSINGLTVTSSTGTLTIANAKTFTANNSITIAGTDGTTQTFQASDTIVGRTTTDTLTNKTLTSPVISTISNTGTLTLPTATGTLAEINVAQTWSGNQTGMPLVTPSIGGETITASPRMTWNGFIQATTALAAMNRWTPDKAITITSIEYQAIQPGSTCSTAPVITVKAGGSSTAATITLANTVAGATTTGLAVNVAGGVLLDTEVTTASVGCGVAWSNVAVTVQYKMQ